jgi:protein gp37
VSDNSAIEWTDATWNPVTGCTKVSRGCDHCYAETFAERWRGVAGHHFENGFDVTLRPERLDQPLRWKKPRRVFVNSMSDLFHEAVPDEFIVTVFARMWWSPQHTFQVLTKRHGRMRSLVPRIEERLREMEHDLDLLDAPTPLRWPLPNVWLGVSVEDQKRADLRIPALLDTPAAVRFLSCEPLLGPISLRGLQTFECSVCCRSGLWNNGRSIAAGDEVNEYWCQVCGAEVPIEGCTPGIGWVIAGGESGPGARPMHPAWARSLRDLCEAAAVPFFLKQLGEYSPYLPMIPDDTRPDGRAPDWDRKPSAWVEEATGRTVTDEANVPITGSWQAVYRVGKKAAGRTLDGQTSDQYPAVTS